MQQSAPQGLILLPRDPRFLDGYRAYCQEFYDHHIVCFRPSNPARIDETWFARTADWYARLEQGLVPGQPVSFHYWAVDGDRFLGEFQLRTELTNEILTGIGSIGCSIRVCEQGKGYGTALLRQGLQLARRHGMARVLANISETNAPSIRICEKCGGVLWDTLLVCDEAEGEHLMRRYWITT